MLVQYAESRFDDIARWFGASPSIDFVESAVADLQSKNIAAVEGKLDHSFVNQQSRSAFTQMTNLLPSSPPKSIRLASLWWTRGSNDAKTVWHTVLSLEYGIDGKWFLINAQVRTEEGEPPILEGLNLQPIPAPLEYFNRFSLQGKSRTHYLFLILLIAIGTQSAAALILCLRQKMPLGRKAIWSIGILSGFGTFTLNWTSGSPQFHLVSFHMPPVGFLRAGLVAPYIFWFSVPVFAIWFLLLHLPSARQIEMDADRTLPSGS
jgi:hypothetical protein